MFMNVTVTKFSENEKFAKFRTHVNFNNFPKGLSFSYRALLVKSLTK